MTINGKNVRWVVDTGAIRSVCGAKVARYCGLLPSGRWVRLVGVGSREAWVAQPVAVWWRGRRCTASIYVVRDEVFPPLLGMAELKALGVVVRPKEGTVTTYAIGWEDELLKAVKQRPADIATGVDESLSDTQLMSEKMGEIRQRVNSELPEDRIAQILQVFAKWAKCWLRPRSGQCTASTARFEVTGRPVKGKLRPLTPALREELDRQLDSAVKAGVMSSDSKSDWASLPVFVKKKDGGYRMAIDYRRVNDQLKSDAYPILLIWDNLQEVAGRRFYTCLDGMWGFWNIPLAKASREVTAVLTHRGLFEYNVLPFGIKNSPGEFQRAMDRLFGDLYYKGVLCYIDDIVIYTDTWEEHLQLVEEVLRRCSTGGLFLKVTKSDIAKPEVSLLGHVVGCTGIRVDPRKVAAIRAARSPRDKKELHSFLGLAGYLRRFVPYFSRITCPLTNLCRPSARFEWTSECQLRFEELKELLAEVVLLAMPKGSGRFVIVCDACTEAVGAVLTQVQDGELVVLEFALRKFNSTEANWDTREKEGYTIKWSVERFSDYLRGMKTLVLTDHASLQWIDKSSAGKVRRWALYLQQFDLEIRSIAGKHNLAADWLSRSVPDPEGDWEIDEICVPTFACSKGIGRVYAPYVPTRTELLEASRDMDEEDCRHCVQGQDGLWYAVRTGRLFIPKALRESVLYWFHVSRFGGHAGVTRTVCRMAKWVFWPRMKHHVADYIRGCLPCRRSGAPKTPYLRDVLERPTPCQLISLDHVGPRNWAGQDWHYLVLVEHATRFMVVRPVKSTGVDEVITCLQEQWVPIFGAPEAILTDRGAAFISGKFRHYALQELTSMLVYAGISYSQGNAINEASHKAIEAALRARAQYDGDVAFPVALQDAVLAYNSTPHSATGESPFFCLFGFEAALPGWQKFAVREGEAVRRAKLQDLRARHMMRSILRADDGLRLSGPNDLAIGDWVVFYRSSYERQTATEAQE